MIVRPSFSIRSILAMMILLGISAGGAQANSIGVSDEPDGLIENDYLVAMGTTERMSVNSNEEQGYGESLRPSISGDGRYVVFWSESSNLVSNDTNGTRDIFLRNNSSSKTRRVSVSSDGTQANNGSGSYITAISSDGRYVAFESYASNLILNDANDRGDIFVHDQYTGQTMLVSIATDGTQGNGDSYWPAISADGKFVAFQSNATNLVSGDTNGKSDVFLHDLLNGTTERLSVASDGTQANDTSWQPTISDDGRYVAFASWATNFVPLDSLVQHIFLHDRDSGQTKLVSVSPDGTQGNSWSSRPSLSGDGEHIAYSSDASNLISGDNNSYQDIFTHDQVSGQTTLVSVASDGTQGNSGSGIPSLSFDGRYIAFYSDANNLVSGDTNNVSDVFLHDQQTALTELLSLSSEHIQGDKGGWVPAISSDGRYVAFESSSSNLVCADTNNQPDIFLRDRSSEMQLSSISGIVSLDDGTPVSNVNLTDSEGNIATTNSEGYYLFDQLIPCRYTITPTLDNYHFTPPFRLVTVPPSSGYHDFTTERRVYAFLPTINRNFCSQRYVDDFSDPQSGWPISDSGNSVYEYLNGEYRILVRNTYWSAAASPNFQATDFTAGVDFYSPSGIHGSFGILFGLAEDWSHFYSFEIDYGSYYGIWRYSNADGWKLLKAEFSPYINTTSVRNSLQVKRDGSTIEVYANNHLLSKIRDDTFVGLYYLGLIVTSYDQPNLEARFDNFFVTPSICSETAQAAISLGSGGEPSRSKRMSSEDKRRFQP